MNIVGIPNMGIKIIFVATNRISSIWLYIKIERTYANIKNKIITSDTIIEDFFSPMKYVNRIQGIKIIPREKVNGTKISWSGISLMLSKYINNTGNNARIKWWNPNFLIIQKVKNEFIYMFILVILYY